MIRLYPEDQVRWDPASGWEYGANSVGTVILTLRDEALRWVATNPDEEKHDFNEDELRVQHKICSVTEG